MGDAMSKLAHSNQESMDEIEFRRAYEEGCEDLIPPHIHDYTIYAKLNRCKALKDPIKAYRLGFVDGSRT